MIHLRSQRRDFVLEFPASVVFHAAPLFGRAPTLLSATLPRNYDGYIRVIRLRKYAGG